MKKLLIFAAILAAAGTATYYISRQIELLKKFCYNLAGYHIINLTRDNLKFEVDLEVKNASSLAIQLISYTFDILLNGIKVSTVTSKTSAIIAPQQMSPLTVVINIDPTDVKAFQDLSVLSNILLDFKNTKIRINGAIAASVNGIKASGIPINIESTFKSMKPAADKPKAPCK